MIENRIAIVVQDQVRRRAGMDAVTRASRLRKLEIVDPVESKQRRWNSVVPCLDPVL